MTREQVSEKVCGILRKQLFIPNSYQITDKDTLSDDLGADSIDGIELLIDFESEFGIEIDDDEVDRVSTVGDVVNGLFEVINVNNN